MIKSLNGKSPRIASSAFIADDATVIGDVTIGENSSVWYGVVIRGDDGPIVIGNNTNVQDNSVLHTDESLIIGDNVTIGHNAIVHCKSVGDCSMIGMGSIALTGSVIGSCSILGAGALLTQNKVLPDKSIAVGSPAKVVRDATDEDTNNTLKNANIYVKLAKEHKSI